MKTLNLDKTIVAKLTAVHPITDENIKGDGQTYLLPYMEYTTPLMYENSERAISEQDAKTPVIISHTEKVNMVRKVDVKNLNDKASICKVVTAVTEEVDKALASKRRMPTRGWINRIKRLVCDNDIVIRNNKRYVVGTRRLTVALLAASNYVGATCRWGNATYIRTSGKLAAVISDSAGYVVSPAIDTVPCGMFVNGQHMNMDVIADNNQSWDDPWITVGRAPGKNEPGVHVIYDPDVSSGAFRYQVVTVGLRPENNAVTLKAKAK